MFKVASVLACLALGASAYHLHHGQHSQAGVVVANHEGPHHYPSHHQIQAPVAHYQHDDHQAHHDYYAHPEYKFEYGVKDPHTGDHKSQWEHRNGDVVKGAYELAEADGTKRVVEYSADHKTGFNAVVKRIGHSAHPQHYGHAHEGYVPQYHH